MADDALRLLLIEGDSDTVVLIKRSLTAGTGGGAFAVTTAPRVSTACRLLAGERFEAVLLDLEVPQNVGLEGFRRIRALAPDAAIVVLAGLRDEDIAAQAVSEGAQDYVTKGTLDFCLLERTMRHAVERKRLSKEVERLLALRRSGDAGAAPARRPDAGEEIKTQFLARVSHELRNTLATMKTAVFCLNDAATEPLTPRQVRLVEMLSRNVDRQVKLIENILDLSRFQSGKLKIDARPMELTRVLDEISSEFRMRSKTQTLEFAIPERLAPVEGDPDLIVQVLRNLLENALRFARSRITVVVADDAEEGVRVTVADDGAGIPKDQVGRLFNQFVQLERTADESGYKGTGLGLAICKEIVEGHRGRIWAESDPGLGTRFIFTLPSAGRREPVPMERGSVGAPLPPLPAPSARMNGLNFS